MKLHDASFSVCPEVQSASVDLPSQMCFIYTVSQKRVPP